MTHRCFMRGTKLHTVRTVSPAGLGWRAPSEVSRGWLHYGHGEIHGPADTGVTEGQQQSWQPTAGTAQGGLSSKTHSLHHNSTRVHSWAVLWSSGLSIGNNYNRMKPGRKTFSKFCVFQALQQQLEEESRVHEESEKFLQKQHEVITSLKLSTLVCYQSNICIMQLHHCLVSQNNHRPRTTRTHVSKHKKWILILWNINNTSLCVRQTCLTLYEQLQQITFFSIQ